MPTEKEMSKIRQQQFLDMMKQNYMAKWGTEQGFNKFKPQQGTYDNLQGYDKHISRLTDRMNYYEDIMKAGPGQEWRDQNQWAPPEWTQEQRAGLVRDRTTGYHDLMRQFYTQKFGSDEGFQRFKPEQGTYEKGPEGHRQRLTDRLRFYEDQMRFSDQPSLVTEPEAAVEDPIAPPIRSGGGSYGGGGSRPDIVPQLAERITQAELPTPERTRSASGKQGWRGSGRGPQGQTVHPDTLPQAQVPVGSRGYKANGKGGF